VVDVFGHFCQKPIKGEIVIIIEGFNAKLDTPQFSEETDDEDLSQNDE
jgi:16S rRNA C1402 (ribose-2'-O) methylase RsmI